MTTLNPKWLNAAVVYDNDGERLGTVAAVDGDQLTVMCKGIPTMMSASQLDAEGRINKSNSITRKYLL